MQTNVTQLVSSKVGSRLVISVREFTEKIYCPSRGDKRRLNSLIHLIWNEERHVACVRRSLADCELIDK
ncbi:hypothetical protein J6590_059851 [Homalodisca vitripennis]|nr:hypothetical protein J6590_059851 [Homalodisca vitripennis]